MTRIFKPIKQTWRWVKSVFFHECGKYCIDITVRGKKGRIRGKFYYRDYDKHEHGAHLVLADCETGEIQIILRGHQRERFLKSFEV